MQLLSTNLPQRGKDCSGINGFLVRDIRKEINAASKRLCCYCGRQNASIQCFKCNEYFHLVCGRHNRCLYTFVDDFRSYCDDCVPRKELQPVGLQKRPSSFERCSICRDQMGLYNEVMFIFGKCCNKGYAHNVCVQQYAMAAGYYLRCLWCRKKDFRDTVRSQGVFVPDRDARWERQKGTYTDLHRGHSTCNMDVCLCPKGRDYKSGRFLRFQFFVSTDIYAYIEFRKSIFLFFCNFYYILGKWSVILCSLCGSVGAHNPKCLLGKENAKEPVTTFKCATCANTEANIINLQEKEVISANTNDVIDKSIFMTKKNINVNKQVVSSFLTYFSEDDETRSSDSFVTVIPRKEFELNTSTSSFSVDSIKDNNTISIKMDSPESVHNNTIITAQKTVIAHGSESGSSVDNSISIQKDVPQFHLTHSRDIDFCIEDTTNVARETMPQAQPPTLFFEDDDTQVFCIDTHKENTVKEISLINKELINEIQDEETEFNESANWNMKGNMGLQSSTEPSSSTTIIDLACSQAANSPDNINQSPVVSSSSQLEKHEEWACFQVYAYDDAKGKCVGSATVRINLSDERFAGLTLEDIEMNSSKLLRHDDIIERCDDIDIFAKFDAIIAEYTI